MSDCNILAAKSLIVNRAEVVSQGCSACGQTFASEPSGARALSALIKPDDSAFMFCAACGDSIMGHLQADTVRERYAWDWAVPLRGGPIPSVTGHQEPEAITAAVH